MARHPAEARSSAAKELWILIPDEHTESLAMIAKLSVIVSLRTGSVRGPPAGEDERGSGRGRRRRELHLERVEQHDDPDARQPIGHRLRRAGVDRGRAWEVERVSVRTAQVYADARGAVVEDDG